ncbi:MAG: hypothetical protein PHR82_02215 [Endomicrobiaceae bacterium]|nr:hypothetical protein [Endomicrobiaceae bacterium]
MTLFFKFIDFLNAYPYIYIFFACLLSCLTIFLTVKINIVRKLFLSFSMFFFMLFFIELILSLYLLPIATKPIELYNKPNNYFPDSGTRYQVSEILLNNGHRKWFLVDKNYPEFKNNFANKKNIVLEAIYTIDENGLRYTKSNINSEETYLFMGCSFVFGACVNDEQTLPYYFSQALDFNKKIINAGQDSKGINRALSFLKSNFFDDIFEKSKIKNIIYLYMDDHISRAFRYNIPSDNMIYENGEVSEIQQPFKLIKKVFIKSLIYNRFFYNFIENNSRKFYLNKIKQQFLNMNEVVQKKYKSNLIVLMWSSQKELEDLFIKNNIDFIEIYKYLDLKTDIVKGDGHPNPSCNKKMSDILLTYLKNRGDL